MDCGYGHPNVTLLFTNARYQQMLRNCNQVSEILAAHFLELLVVSV